MLILDPRPVTELSDFLGSVDLLDGAFGTKSEFVLGELLGYSSPDSTSTVSSGESESSVGSPVRSCFHSEGVAHSGTDVGCGHTFTKPFALHLVKSAL